MLTKRELELTEQTAQQWVRVGDLFHRTMGERTLNLISEVRQFRAHSPAPTRPSVPVLKRSHKLEGE